MGRIVLVLFVIAVIAVVVIGVALVLRGSTARKPVSRRPPGDSQAPLRGR